MLETLLDQVRGNSVAELVAMVLAIAYLLLAIKEHISCWYAAFVSTAIYLVVFLDAKLYMDSALQVYYLAMAVYGWYEWKYGDRNKAPIPITTWSLQTHVLVISATLMVTAASAWALATWTPDPSPVLDAFTTWGAIVSTWMVARKILENWAYWLVIDGVSIYLYASRELYFTMLLFVIYVVLIGFGWIAWLRSYRESRPALG